MTHLLTGLGARLREAKAVHHVVQTALEDAQQVLARDALLAAGDLVVVMELLLQNAVDALGLLLLTQLQTVFAFLDTLLAGLAGRVVAALDRALVRVAAVALQEELRTFTTAQTAVRSSITSHNTSILSVTRDDACADGNRCAEWVCNPECWRLPGRRPAASGWPSRDPNPGP